MKGKLMRSTAPYRTE